MHEAVGFCWIVWGTRWHPVARWRSTPVPRTSMNVPCKNCIAWLVEDLLDGRTPPSRAWPWKTQKLGCIWSQDIAGRTVHQKLGAVPHRYILYCTCVQSSCCAESCLDAACSCTFWCSSMVGSNEALFSVGARGSFDLQVKDNFQSCGFQWCCLRLWSVRNTMGFVLAGAEYITRGAQGHSQFKCFEISCFGRHTVAVHYSCVISNKTHYMGCILDTARFPPWFPTWFPTCIYARCMMRFPTSFPTQFLT